MYLSSKKEELSICYISTLCAHAGISYDISRHDDDSTDGILRKMIYLDKNIKYNAELRIQLKSTSSTALYSDKDTFLTYKLKAKNYNDLCCHATSPIILGLLILPEDESSWVKWTTEALLLKGCMYWTELSQSEVSNNESTVSIKINKQNVITAETLSKILDKIAREDWP